MPCQARAERVAVGRVTRHSQIVNVIPHKQMVQMLVMEEEPQADRPHIKTRIGTHPRVVSYVRVALGTEHTRLGTQYRRVVAREIAYVHTHLRVQRLPPRAVVV